MRRSVELSSLIALIGVTFIASTSPPTRAAKPAMFERGFVPLYKKTEDGLRTRLRRIDIGAPSMALVDTGHEIGRIRGYPGSERFWMQLAVPIQKPDTAGTGGERAQVLEKAMRDGR